jgi:hypothetical protein
LRSNLEKQHGIFMRRTIAIFFLLLPVMAANAQVLQDEAEQEPRRYTVEMIVFTYAEDIGSGGEVFVADPPPDDTQSLDAAIERAQPAPAAPAIFPDTGLARMSWTDFTMGDIRSRLDRLSAYQPVMHFGWTQSTYPAEQTRDIRLASIAARAGGIDGTLKLYLSRFLHLVVDLQMDADAEPMSDTFAPAVPPRYRIQEDRIFRSGELRYFDHPKFGVLAKVTRAEEDDVEEDDAEEAEDPAPDTGELLGYPTQ